MARYKGIGALGRETIPAAALHESGLVSVRVQRFLDFCAELDEVAA